MKRMMFLVALALPAVAHADLPTFQGKFGGTVTGGTLFMYFPNGSYHDPSPNIVGNTIDLSVDAWTSFPFGDPVLAGYFNARVNEVQPVAARDFFGENLFDAAGARITLTATTFTFQLSGGANGDNNTGDLKLMADRQGQTLVNWRGIASGFVQPLGVTEEEPSDYSYNNVTFSLDKVTFLLNGSQTVPEPATWASMICGFGMAGAAMRRARRGRTTLVWKRV